MMIPEDEMSLECLYGAGWSKDASWNERPNAEDVRW